MIEDKFTKNKIDVNNIKLTKSSKKVVNEWCLNGWASGIHFVEIWAGRNQKEKKNKRRD